MATATANPPAVVEKKEVTAIVVDKFTPPAVFFEDGLGTKDQWVAACNVFYPEAASLQTIVTVFRYCAARKIDIMTKPFFIVTIENVDNIWPSIVFNRILAHRTGEYAGQEKPVWGPVIQVKFGNDVYDVPEYCEVTVYRERFGRRESYTGISWAKEAVMLKDGKPNKMWAKRYRGQMEKCAEALALKKGFPEEVGSEPTVEEMGEHEGYNEIEEVKKRATVRAAKKSKESDAIQTDYVEVNAEAEGEEETQSSFEPPAEDPKQIEAKPEPIKLVVPTADDKMAARIEIAQEKGNTAKAEQLKDDQRMLDGLPATVEPQKLIIVGMKTGWKAAQTKAYVLEKLKYPFEEWKTKMTREEFDELMVFFANNKPEESKPA